MRRPRIRQPSRRLSLTNGTSPTWCAVCFERRSDLTWYGAGICAKCDRESARHDICGLFAPRPAVDPEYAIEHPPHLDKMAELSRNRARTKTGKLMSK